MLNLEKSARRTLSAAFFVLLAVSARAQDAEKSAHEKDDSVPLAVHEEKGDGFLVRQYRLGCLSLLSYLVVSDGHAAVIDPQRDVERYVEDAKSLGARIERVILTHSHADFVAGHTELADVTKAEIVVDADMGAVFPHRPVRDGDKLTVGRASFEFWKTPGHVLASITALLTVPGKTPAPAFAFTGDTLFIGGIGRPDLTDVPAGRLASLGFDSIRRLKTLPDRTMVLPAHGAGSLCGAHLSPETTSTIGAEKATNPFLKIESRARFVAALLAEKTHAPAYFAKNVEINRLGPPVVRRAGAPPEISAAAAKAKIEAGAWVVDVRAFDDYARGHISGSINIALRGRLDTWTGTVVPFKAPLLLVGSSAETEEGAFRLRRIGFDLPAGRLAPDLAAWREAGLDVRDTAPIDSETLAQAMRAGTEPLIIDVRTASEWAEIRIPGAVPLTLTDWPRYGAVLDKTTPTIFVCNSAYRSSMAVGLAERSGLQSVASLAGGLDAWFDGRRPVEGTAVVDTSGPSTQPSAPTYIEASALAAATKEASALTILDVRPAFMAADYKIPGSQTVAPAAVEDAALAAAAERPIVLVDTDGFGAAALAGALLERRPELKGRLRVLIGGIRAYWSTIELKRDGAPGVMPPAGEAPSIPSPGAKPVKKRNPGC